MNFLRFSFCNIQALVYRYYLEYRHLVLPTFLGDVLERVLFFIAFGMGLGKAVQEIAGVPYMTFLAPGIAAGSGVFIMAMATTYGVSNRVNTSRVWQSWLATPIKLQDILLSELLFDTLRTILPLIILYGVAFSFGAIPSLYGAMLTLPILILANIVYGSITLTLSGFLGNVIYFRYIQSLWVMPMYLFSGVFFDVTQASEWMQYFAHIFPLYYVLEIARPLILGEDLIAHNLLITLFVLSGFFVVSFALGYHFFKKRLFD